MSVLNYEPHRRLDHKHYIVLVLMVTVALMISSIDIYIPAMPFLKSYFGVSEFYVQMSIAITPLVSVLAALPIGRLADTRGRRPLLLWGCVLFCVGSFFCGFSSSFLFFCVGRLVQALGNTMVSVVSIVILADFFKGVQYARYIAIYVSIFPLMFALAPVVGAYFLEWFGWQFSFFFLGGGVLGVLVFFTLMLRETKKTNGDEGRQSHKFAAAASLLMKTPFFLAYVLGHTLPICISGIFMANAAFIFIQSFNFSPTSFAIVQAIPILCNFGSALVYRKLISSIGLSQALRFGVMGFCVFSVLCGAVLMELIPHTPLTILGLLTIANIFMPYLIATCSTRVFELSTQHKGLAVALVSVFRNVGLVLSVGCSSLFYDGTIHPVLMGMFFVSLFVCLVLFPCMKQKKLSIQEI